MTDKGSTYLYIDMLDYHRNIPNNDSMKHTGRAAIFECFESTNMAAVWDDRLQLCDVIPSQGKS